MVNKAYIAIRKTNAYVLTSIWRSQTEDWLEWLEFRLQNSESKQPYEAGWQWAKEFD